MSEFLQDKIRKAMQGEEKWALLYLMEWDAAECNKPRFVRGGKAIFPDVHGFYDTEAEAYAMKNSKIHPEGYHVCRMRNYTGSGI
jgi:hypothetical protein